MAQNIWIGKTILPLKQFYNPWYRWLFVSFRKKWSLLILFVELQFEFMNRSNVQTVLVPVCKRDRQLQNTNSNVREMICWYMLNDIYKESVSLFIHNCPWVNPIQLTIWVRPWYVWVMGCMLFGYVWEGKVTSTTEN